MKDGHSQLNMAEVPGADLDVLLAGGALEHAVDGAQLGVIEALGARQVLLLVHGLGVDDAHHAHGLDLLGREEAELNLLDGAQRALGHRGGAAESHGGGMRVVVSRRASWLREATGGGLEDGRGGLSAGEKPGRCRGMYVTGRMKRRARAMGWRRRIGRGQRQRGWLTPG
jgi:hypothetical protein